MNALKENFVSVLNKMRLFIGNKFLSKFKYLFLFSLPIVLAVSILLIVRNNPSEITIGFIADIHAGDQEYRNDGEEANNILIPDNFEKNVKNALENMKDADLIFALGDNLNRPSKKNTKKLLEITEGYPFYWAKGNHDESSDFNEFLSSKNYYLKDKGRWRFIVLDNSLIFPDSADKSENGRGYIDDKQLIWLKKSLKTKKDVVIMMHIPIFDRYDLLKVRSEEQYLEDILAASGNVKHVFSGHFHIYDRQIERNGIIYHLIPSISLAGGEGEYSKITLE